jgi:hypothetical protein
LNKTISRDFFVAVPPLLYACRVFCLAPFAYLKRTLPGGRISEQLQHGSASFIYSSFVAILVLFSSLCAIIFIATNWYSEMGTSVVVVADILIYTANTTPLAFLVLNLTKNKN